MIANICIIKNSSMARQRYFLRYLLNIILSTVIKANATIATATKAEKKY